MTDVTKNWAGGEPLGETRDSTIPAAETTKLTPDTGEHTPPAATAPAETRSFAGSVRGVTQGQAKPDGSKANISSASARPVDGGAQSTPEEETLLRASLETIRLKAEALGRQAGDWTQARSERALQVIDQRPVTAIAAAFGAGLIVGALLSR